MSFKLLPTFRDFSLKVLPFILVAPLKRQRKVGKEGYPQNVDYEDAKCQRLRLHHIADDGDSFSALLYRPWIHHSITLNLATMIAVVTGQNGSYQT